MIARKDQPPLPLYRMRVYNPGKLTDAEIEIAFVARHDVLNRILDDLDGERPKSRAQHHLIVGQKGMGKTTLLLRLAAALRKQPRSARFVPLVFAEEQYSVDRLSKFWLNCLDSLADACELIGDEEAVARIDEMVRRLPRSVGPAAKDDNDAARAALDSLLVEAQRLARRPVLLVDNLQIVFDRITEQQHDLREVLMRPDAPIVVAASPQLPDDVQDYSAPFYDQFKTHYLRALDVDGMRRVLLALADAAARDDIRQHVVGHPGRLQALYHLTGGNPRTTVLLFHLYADDISPSVYADLEKLLDDVTPLYKARFEELSDQMQVVASAIAENWDPITSRQLSEATGLSAGRISSQLDRLKKLGVVEEVELYGTKRNGFQIAERFFDVWYLMRHSSRRQRRQVTFLTRFLETLYDPAQREHFAQHMSREHGFSSDRIALGLSLAGTLENENVRAELVRNVHLEALELHAKEPRRRIRELLELSDVPPQTIAFDDLRRRLRELLGDELASCVLRERSLLESGEGVREMIAGQETVPPAQQDAMRDLLATFHEANERRYGAQPVDWFSDRLESGQLSDASNVQDWIRTIEQGRNEFACIALLADTMPLNAFAKLPQEMRMRIRDTLVNNTDDSFMSRWSAIDWNDFGNDLMLKFTSFDHAEHAYRRAIEIDANDARPWNGLGSLLQYHLQRYQEAEDSYRRAIEIDANFAYPWNGLGNLLQYHLQRYQEAEDSYRKAIEIDANLAKPWNGLGNLLQYHLQRYPEAEEAYRRAIEIDANFASPWNGLGNLLQYHLQRYPEAEEAYRRAIEIDANLAYPWNNMGNLLCDYLARFEEAEDAYRKAHAINPKEIIYTVNLVFLVRDFVGRIEEARRIFAESGMQGKKVDNVILHEVLFAAYDHNWGTAAEHMNAALDLISDGIFSNTIDDWIRTSAVLLRLGFGKPLLELIEGRGDDQRLRPWYEALKAHHASQRKVLQNIAVEVRSTAEWFFDQIQHWLNTMPSHN